MKYKWIVEIMCWKFEFDDPDEALRFFKTAFKHYLNEDGEYTAVTVMDMEIRKVKVEEKPEEKPEEEAEEKTEEAE